MTDFFRRLEQAIGTHLRVLTLVLMTISLVGLYLTTRVSYLLFHSLAELFSIAVATALFMIAWNSRKYIANQYLLFVGIAYFFIALLDLFHTLSYKGMSIFSDYDFYANQLWIAARYMESLTLLAAFYFLLKNRTIWPYLTFAFYAFVTGLLLSSIFRWQVFPVCFVEGQGLTPFKKNSEYLICLILLCASALLVRNRRRFEPEIFRLLLASIVCTVVSELAFTFYISNYGLSNLVGHYFKIFSFSLIYLAIITTGVENPFKLFFLELETANKQLTREVQVRKETERNLTSALENVKTLSGLLPICSSCKNVRDDRGYWNQIESYLQTHSEAEFSHGICPDCIARIYPDMQEEILKEAAPVLPQPGMIERKDFQNVHTLAWKTCMKEEVPLSIIVARMRSRDRERDVYGTLAPLMEEAAAEKERYWLCDYDRVSCALIVPDTSSDQASQTAETIQAAYDRVREQAAGGKAGEIQLLLVLVTVQPTALLTPKAMVQLTDESLGEAEQKNLRIIQKSL